MLLPGTVLAFSGFCAACLTPSPALPLTCSGTGVVVVGGVFSLSVPIFGSPFSSTSPSLSLSPFRRVLFLFSSVWFMPPRSPVLVQCEFVSVFHLCLVY